MCLRPSVPDAELARALPEGVALAEVEPVLANLEAAALVWRHGGQVHCSGILRQCMPTALGPPVHSYERALTVEHLRHAVGLLRPLLEEAGHTGPLPPPATGEQGRPARKADLLDDLAALLSVDGAAAAVSAAAPAAAAVLLERLAEGPHAARVSHSLWFSPQSSRSYYAHEPTYWLFERGLLLPERDGVALLPRELTLSWRGGRPVADLALAEPVVPALPVDAGAIDHQGATQVARLLDHAAELLDAWRAEPAKALKSGGLGVTALRSVAARLEVDVADATRLVELLYAAGLLEETTTTHRVKRVVTYEMRVGPRDEVAEAWLARPAAVRWRQLASAWLRAQHWPSLAGRPLREAKPLPALDHQYALGVSATSRRAVVLGALAARAPGEAVDPAALAEHLYWLAPQPWLQVAPMSWKDAITWTVEVAEALGIAAQGALTSFGRALWEGQPAAAEATLVLALPAAATAFTLQADLTAVVVGRLDRGVATELRLLADVESTGAATPLRFSDASLRRGLDAGRDAAGITAFLERHAAKGVPKPLRYLVADVARRHGHLQVGAVGSFVTSDDPAVLADAVSHRRARKLALRLLAPTVAVSPEPAAKLLATLREAGFLPVLDGEAPATITLPAATDEPASHALVDASADLPEPFRQRGSSLAPVLDASEAAQLAAAILDLDAVNGWDDLEVEPDDVESLDEIFEEARRGRHVVGLMLRGADEPIMLRVAGWDGVEVQGTDIVTDTPMWIAAADIVGALDVGAVTSLPPARPRARKGGR